MSDEKKNWSPPSGERAVLEAREGVSKILEKMLSAAPSKAGRVCVAALLMEVVIEDLRVALRDAKLEITSAVKAAEQRMIETGEARSLPKQPPLLGMLLRKAATIEQRAGNLYGEALALYPKYLSEMNVGRTGRRDQGD